MGGDLFAKLTKDKLLSDQPETCVTVTARFWPLLGWEEEKVMCEERWGKGRNRLGKRLIAEQNLTNFKRKLNKMRQ